MSTAPRLLPYVKRQWKWLFVGSIAGIITNTSVVLPPIYFGKAVDLLVQQEKGGLLATARSELRQYILLFLGTTLLFALGRMGKRYGFRLMANSLNCCLRRDLLASAFTWSMPRWDRERIGDIMSRAVGDVQVLSDVVQSTVTEIFDTLLLMISILVTLIIIQPTLTLWATLPIPFAILLAQAMGPHVFRRATRVRESNSQFTHHLHQMLHGIRIFRLLGREGANNLRFAELSKELRDSNVSFSLLQGGVMPVYSAIASLGIVLVVGLGGFRVLEGHWTVGGFTAYLTMFTTMSARTLMAARVINRVHLGQAAWARIVLKLSDRNPCKNIVEHQVQVRTHQGLAITLANLSFTYVTGEQPVIRDLSLSIPSGSLVGITGPVGSGKTALALALSGLYPYTGSIRYGDRELSTLDVDERISAIAYMDQDAFLFSATIAENIGFLPWEHLNQTRIQQVSHWAALSEDLPLFEGGYQTLMGEMGVRASGGQRQRMALARTLYPGTPILILDDPFSAVDLATEQQMIARLREAFSSSTILLFSHRLASFTMADQIVVLNRGLIEEQGNHQELMHQSGMYSRIYQAQHWLEEQAG